MPADGGLALHEIDMIAAVGDLQRRLDARDAAADHQRRRVDGHDQWLQRLVQRDPLHPA